MKNFRLISGGVDVGPLGLALQRRPEMWKEDTYLRHYPQGPFGDTESIILRFPERKVVETQEELEERLRSVDGHECVDQPAYKVLPEARPLVMNLMAYAAGERLGRVMINKIRPGGTIYPHKDTPEHATYWDRFHIVVSGLPGVMFRCGDEKVNMMTGQVWWFQNAEEHEVINNSADDRIHMIVDIRCSR